MAEAVVVAAGRGRRMGGVEKQFLPLGGKPVVYYPLRTLDASPSITGIILVVPPGKVEYARHMIHDLGISKVKKVVEGGEERQDSVMRGLEHVEDGVVLIHDGVRPFLRVSLVERISREAGRFGAVVPGIPVKDTLKKVEHNEVIKTLERGGVYAIQTPQGFDKEILLDAYRKAYKDGFYATDDAGLVERAGYTVRVVEGDALNLKITTKDDIILAGAILQMLERRYEGRDWI